MSASFASMTSVTHSPLRVVVLASGSGTLLQSIIDHQGAYEVCGVVADVSCQAIERAESAGIPSAVVQFQRGGDRQAWDRQLVQQVSEYHPDLVVSAGFMKILGRSFLDVYEGRTVNTHPALLPAFPGAHAVRDALSYGVKVTGTTVHLVDEGVDTGAILAQRALEVRPGETEAELHERIKAMERDLIVAVLQSTTIDQRNGEVAFEL